MKIACILADGFEDSEFRVPYDRLKAAGFEVVIIAEKEGQELVGKQGKERVRSDRSIDTAIVEDYDALFIPGGYAPDKLREDPRFVGLVAGFDDAQKLIATICHGPQLLLTADRVRNRTMTAWSTVQVDLRRAGANVVDREVVVDDNLLTSRKPDDLDAFSSEFIRQLEARAGEQRPSQPAT